MKLFRFDYALHNAAGDVVDASPAGQPLAMVEGDGRLIAGLARALGEHAVGDRFSVTVAPGEAYGEHDASLVTRIALANLDIEKDAVEVGAVLRFGVGDGARIGKVTEVFADHVVIDSNHPLAGLTLQFEITLVESREATNEELLASRG